MNPVCDKSVALTLHSLLKKTTVKETGDGRLHRPVSWSEIIKFMILALYDDVYSYLHNHSGILRLQLSHLCLRHSQGWHNISTAGTRV